MIYLNPRTGKQLRISDTGARARGVARVDPVGFLKGLRGYETERGEGEEEGRG
jgi:hypothetical protein